MKPNTECIYYDKYCKEHGIDGCCTCTECFIEKCPVAVERMSPEEKKFYCVKEDPA